MKTRTSSRAVGGHEPALESNGPRPTADLVQQQPANSGVNTRLKISALWTATLFIFAYVDLFTLFRPDVRADLEQGRIFVFNVSQAYLFFTTLYVIVPSAMIYLTLVMSQRVNRIVNMVVAAVYAVTIIGSAVGEWNYFILGSAVEAILLALVVYHAWTWRVTPGGRTAGA